MEVDDCGAVGQIDLQTMRRLLDETKKGSAAGEDTLSYDILKLCSDQTLSKVCHLFNQCISKCLETSKGAYVTEAWPRQVPALVISITSFCAS